MEYQKKVYSWKNIQTALNLIRNYEYEIKVKAQHTHNLYRLAEFIDEQLIPLDVGILCPGFGDHELLFAWTNYSNAIKEGRTKAQLDQKFKFALERLEQDIREVIHMARNGEVDITE